jgi:hypothetical protein
MAGFLTETRPPHYCARCGDRTYPTDDGRYICLRCTLGEHLTAASPRSAPGAGPPSHIEPQHTGCSALPTRTAAWLPRAIVAGFAASAVMLVGFVLAYGLTALLGTILPPEPLRASVLRDWVFALTHNTVLDIGLSSLYAAIAIYFVGGLSWAVLYGGLAEPRLPGPAWARGVTFALAPAAVSLLVVLPALGGGWLGLALGAGPLPLLGNLLLHVLYGATLGLLYGPMGDLSVDTLRPRPEADRGALAAAERATARAILAGLLVGATVGALGFLLGGRHDEPQVLGAPPALGALAALVGGAGLGAAIGPLLGMPGASEEPS